MLKYGKNISFNPDKLDLLNIDRQSISQIPPGSSVLEIGCATGFMGEYLIKNKGCTVLGVEYRKDEVRMARGRLNKVIQGDIEDRNTIMRIKEKYDIVFASAIIEHLKDPWSALRTWRTFLKKTGYLIITTSNIAHWSIRLKILQGKFDYEEYGILDNTHLHFFTIDSFRTLLIDSGYRIDYFSIDSVGGGFPRLSKFFSRFLPNFFAYQMLIKARSK